MRRIRHRLRDLLRRLVGVGIGWVQLFQRRHPRERVFLDRLMSEHRRPLHPLFKKEIVSGQSLKWTNLSLRRASSFGLLMVLGKLILYLIRGAIA